MLTISECVFLNLIDGIIDEGMSDMLRSSPSPVDENITIKVIYCVVRHAFLLCCISGFLSSFERDKLGGQGSLF